VMYVRIRQYPVDNVVLQIRSKDDWLK